MKIKVSLLQVPRIWVNEKEFSFPLRKADALFYYMVCTKSATREELIALLWAECDIEAGRKNLRNVLYTIKKSLEEDVFVTIQKSKLCLRSNVTIECDYDRLMEQNDYLAFHGQFLSGFSVKDANAFDEWIWKMRERIKQQYLACLSQLATSTEETGAWGRAERCALDYLRENPADETMACFLMELYQQHSKFTEAVHVYQTLHDYLAQEMGISPVSSTTQLYYDILKDWNAATTPAQSTPLGKLYIPPSQRNAYRELYQRCIQFSKAEHGTGSTVLLQGSQGTGKSFFLSHIGECINGALPLLQTRCFPSGQNERYGVWHSILLDLKSRSPDSSNSHNTLFEAMEHHTALKDEAYEQGILELFHLQLHQYKMVLIIEDIQWIDPSSLKLLSKVAHIFFNRPLLILLSSRKNLPVFVQNTIICDRADRLLHIIQLPALTLQDTREWIQIYFNGATAASTVDVVYQASKGSIALLKSLCQQAANAEDPMTVLTHGAEHLLQERLDALSSQSLHLLHFVSYFSKGAPKATAEIALKYTTSQIELMLGELAEAYFPVESIQQDNDILLSIQDEFLRQKLYLSEPPERRTTIHKFIAEMLASFSATESNLRMTIYHYFKGNCPVEALNKLGQLYKQYLKRLYGQGDGFFQQILAAELPELERAMTVADQIPQETPFPGRQWLLLMDIAMALFSQRLNEIPNQLIKLFSIVPQINGEWFPLTLGLFSHYAWQKKNAEQLFEAISVCDDIPEEYWPFYQIILAELLSLSGQYFACGETLHHLLEKSNSMARAYAAHGLGLNEQREKGASGLKQLDYAAQQADHVQPFYGIAQIYLDAGRAAQAEGQHELASKRFHSALYLAVKTNDRETLIASQAYLSIVYGLQNQYLLSSQYLRQSLCNGSDSPPPFAAGCICFAQASLKILFGPKEYKEVCDLLAEPIERYCRKGLLLLSAVQDAGLEVTGLRACLKG